MSNWQSTPPYNSPVLGQPLAGDSVGYRSEIDAMRSAAGGKVPYAAYPDGYLGNVNSRRDDRLLKDVQSRLTQRSYQRGVHKGERIDPVDYYWDDQVHPMAGIEAQARGEKWTASGSTPAEQINHLGKNHLLKPDEYAREAARVGVKAPQMMSDDRRAKMSSLLPSWS